MNNINKVKSKILNVFLNLIETNKLEDISIKTITDSCGIARSSFYRNFNSIDEIIIYYFETIFDMKHINSINVLVGYINNSFSLLDDNSKNLRKINKINRLSLLNVFFKKKYLEIESQNSVKSDAIQFDFYVYTFISLVGSYLEDEDISLDELKEKYELLTLCSVNKVIALNKENVDVISVKNMRDSDAYTIANFTPSKELMYRAGEAIFNSVNWFGKTAIICGKGNNAGDGYVLAKLLKDSGHEVKLFLVDNKFSEDGKNYFDKANVEFELINEETSFANYDILVDCLLGTGFSGAPRGNIALAINKINEANKYVVAVDINSGLNGDSGLAELAVKSNLTISIGNYKTGHFLNMAKDYILDKKNADIGIKPIYKTYKLLGASEVKNLLKPRSNMSNKGDFGYNALIGGSRLYSGAIRLSNLANSTMAMGGGVTLLATPKSISDYIIPNILESTIYPLSDEDGFISFNKDELDHLMKRCKTIAIGMGMGLTNETIKAVEYLLTNYERNLILDADALNAISKLGVDILLGAKCKIILTPHIKEFSRLTNENIEVLQGNSIEKALEFANKYNCILLLKGPTTIVTDGEEVYLTDRGCSGMATAGSGDVLSGILASIVSSNDEKLLQSVSSGAYINGLAGEIASLENGEISMVASDTAKCIKKAIKMIQKC